MSINNFCPQDSKELFFPILATKWVCELTHTWKFRQLTSVHGASLPAVVGLCSEGTREAIAAVQTGASLAGAAILGERYHLALSCGAGCNKMYYRNIV